ncbi:hypothetical protein EVA_08432 [gut metagenome]|uniref:Uncharacterized protein n=1 Tax=gut metagenome TaxID=749906 RepID=J9CTB8_9ZZZZ
MRLLNCCCFHDDFFLFSITFSCFYYLSFVSYRQHIISYIKVPDPIPFL